MNSCEGYVEPGVVFFWVMGTIFLSVLITGLISKVLHQSDEIHQLRKPKK
jgi:hypothetical protein